MFTRLDPLLTADEDHPSDSIQFRNRIGSWKRRNRDKVSKIPLVTKFCINVGWFVLNKTKSHLNNIRIAMKRNLKRLQENKLQEKLNVQLFCLKNNTNNYKVVEVKIIRPNTF